MGVGCWMGVGRLAVGCWVLQGGDEVALPELRWLVWKPRPSTSRRYSQRRCRRPVGIAIAERWVLGCWVLGVGCEAGSPRGPALKRALGRSLAACFAPPWLVHLPPTSPPLPTSPPTPTSPPPPPKGKGREPRAAACPLNAPRVPNGVPTPSIQEDTAKRKKNFWALGVRYWALGACGFGRWVSPTDLGCWVARTTCWVLGVGRWMPLAKALGGVGGHREATAMWEHEYCSPPRSRRQQDRLGLERSTGEV